MNIFDCAVRGFLNNITNYQWSNAMMILKYGCQMLFTIKKDEELFLNSIGIL